MINGKQAEQMSSKGGFIAALDQSGGSTPKALRLYGIPESDYSNDEEMFGLIHDMRSRIVTAPCFNGKKVIGAIKPCHSPIQNPATSPSGGATSTFGFAPAAQADRSRAINNSAGISRFRFIGASLGSSIDSVPAG